MSVNARPLDGVPGNSGLASLASSSVSRRISPWKACALLLELRLTRLRNRMLGGSSNNPSSAGSRQATTGRKAGGWTSLVLALGIGLPVLTGYGVFLGKLLPRMYGASAHGLIPMASAHLVVLMLAALLLSLGLANKDLNRLDGDMEWLLTLPASIPSLYAMKLVERTLLNLYAWVLIYPLVLAMVTQGEFSCLATTAALLLSLPLFLLVAYGYVLVEGAARVWFPKLLINSIQFTGTLCGIALLMTIPLHPHWVAPLAILPWPSVSQAVSLAFAHTLASRSSLLWHLARYGFETAGVLAAGHVLLQHVTSRGAVVGAGAAQGRRGAGSSAPLERGFLARGMVKKELLQLVRDKKTLYLALVFPGILLFPLFMLAQKPRYEHLFASPTDLPVLAFCAGAVAILSVTNLLHAEGKALWLLFTLPRSLSRMLAERALVWVPVCLGYACLVLGYGLYRQPVSRDLVLGSAYCLFGLTLLTLIAAGLGLHAVDADAIESERGSQQGGLQMLLLFVLFSAFASGFYVDTWLRGSLCVLLAASAYGVWQNASRRLPFLLEPDLRPAPHVGVLDGLICVLLILVIEVFGEPFAMDRWLLTLWPARALTFVAAVGIVGGGASFLFWQRGCRDWAASLGLSWAARPRVALQQGLSWALPAVGVGVVSVLAVRYWPWRQAFGNQSLVGALPSVLEPRDLLLLLLITCIGAPFCEELLFRGMIYRSLRESLSPRASALFAACVFVAIHPSTAWVPVFLLSLFAAASFERSRSLVSPILVHTAYNVSVFLVSALVSF